jgi:hypothetical protein
MFNITTMIAYVLLRRMLQPGCEWITERMIYKFCQDYIMSAQIVFLVADQVA